MSSESSFPLSPSERRPITKRSDAITKRSDDWMAHLEAARIILKNQDRNGWEERIYAALQQITAGAKIPAEQPSK